MTDRPQGEQWKATAATKVVGRGGLILAGCWLLLGVLGWLDYATGYEMSFFVFYSVPVGVAAWWVGRWSAIGLALGATVTWLLADYFSGAKYSAPFFYCWNSTIHFTAFMINAVTIAKIKSDLDRRNQLATELESARKALRDLTAPLPICPACGRPREAAGGSGETGGTPLARQYPEFADALRADASVNSVQTSAEPGYFIPSTSPTSSRSST